LNECVWRYNHGDDGRSMFGYGLAAEAMPFGPRACYWGVYGGSLVVIDQDTALTVAYVMTVWKAGRRSVISAVSTSWRQRCRRLKPPELSVAAIPKWQAPFLESAFHDRQPGEPTTALGSRRRAGWGAAGLPHLYLYGPDSLGRL
jgi:hypothetical protein